ncbi:hypothetical protein BT63DRAFT_471514 [Microthyrium microscopicum]|uniref:Uncharacterized protein n=1 Tax=Microthyrium microscopicum TaxID=703497 RepID=A0A6A6UB78_9PEZI|nr:hypothetical protein BT63DRAFT_471514 [Microthyrium microscopicum]
MCYTAELFGALDFSTLQDDDPSPIPAVSIEELECYNDLTSYTLKDDNLFGHDDLLDKYDLWSSDPSDEVTCFCCDTNHKTKLKQVRQKYSSSGDRGKRARHYAAKLCFKCQWGECGCTAFTLECRCPTHTRCTSGKAAAVALKDLKRVRKRSARRKGAKRTGIVESTQLCRRCTVSISSDRNDK